MKFQDQEEQTPPDLVVFSHFLFCYGNVALNS